MCTKGYYNERVLPIGTAVVITVMCCIHSEQVNVHYDQFN